VISGFSSLTNDGNHVLEETLLIGGKANSTKSTELARSEKGMDERNNERCGVEEYKGQRERIERRKMMCSMRPYSWRGWLLPLVSAGL
jgi:hypothetical protein